MFRNGCSLFPWPDAFLDEAIRRAGEAAARRATQKTKAPCEYRGFLIGDPSNPSTGRFVTMTSEDCQEDSKAGAKTQQRAWFEWCCVQQTLAEGGARPHFVSMPVKDFLGEHEEACGHMSELRDVPFGPLGTTAPSGLLFSLGFMAAVAENVKAGTQFKGIIFDHDRPDLEMQLPRGGQDIQNVEVRVNYYYHVSPGAAN